VAPDTPARLVSCGGGHAGQVAAGGHVEAINQAELACRQAELAQGGVGGDRRQVDLFGGDVAPARVAGAGGGVSAGKNALPGGEHVGGGVEPLGGVAVQRPLEERRQRLAHERVEPVGGDGGHHVVGQLRGGRAVTPPGGGAGGHLVQRDRGGIALRGQIPSAGGPLGQERVAIAHRARVQVRPVAAGQREVEHQQVALLVLAAGDHAEVGGLEVAVSHAVALQQRQRAEQVGAEALQQVQRHWPVALEARAEGLVGGLQAQHQAAAELGEPVGGHDALVAQLVEGGVLVAQPLGGVVVAGDLEHLAATGGVVGQQHRARRASAEAASHGPSADPVAGGGVDRVGLVGAGEVLHGVVEPGQEVIDRHRPVGRRLAGGLGHGDVEAGVGVVADRRQRQVAVLGQQRVAGCAVGRGRAAGEDQHRYRPQREHVGQLRVGVGDVVELGGEIAVGVVRQQRREIGSGHRRVLGGGGGGGAPDRLPVADLELAAVAALGDDHVLGHQRAVGQALLVGVAQDLGELADQLDAGEHVELVGVVSQPVVQADRVRIVVEHLHRPALVGLELQRLVDAGMVDGGQQLELAAGGALELGALGLGGAFSGAKHPQTALHLPAVGVLAKEVLPEGPLGEDLAELVGAHAPVGGRLADARLVHGLGHGVRQGGVHAGAASGIDVGQVGDDARQRQAVALLVLRRVRAKHALLGELVELDGGGAV
jgi:hypothetical protein